MNYCIKDMTIEDRLKQIENFIYYQDSSLIQLIWDNFDKFKVRQTHHKRIYEVELRCKRPDIVIQHCLFGWSLYYYGVNFRISPDMLEDMALRIISSKCKNKETRIHFLEKE